MRPDLNLLRNFVLIFLSLACAAAVAAHVTSITSAETFNQRNEQFIAKLRNHILDKPYLVSFSSLRDISFGSGMEIVVFLKRGSFASDERMLAENYEFFEANVQEKSTKPVVISDGTRPLEFRSIPVAAHPEVIHIFVQTNPFHAEAVYPTVSEMLLIALACLIGAFLFSMLMYIEYHMPMKGLAAAIEAASAEEEPRIHYLNRSGPSGELARSIRRAVMRLRRKQSNQVESERIAVFRQVTAGIAHEVRNPLTAMRMTVQMMHKRFKGEDEKVREWLEVLVAEIDRLKNHMDQLMEFGGQYVPDMRQTNIEELVNDTLLLLRRQLDHANVSVITSYEDSLPLIFVDPDQIKQVLINILLNSVQAMPKGGTLSISAMLARVEGVPVMTLAIEDEGPGIPEDVRERIFEPFFSTKKAGTGLGLSIAKRIIEQHGGRIRFVSSDKGTIFRMFLPTSPQSARLASISTDHFKTLEEGDGEEDTGS
ncbi:MAG: ATP-binding protein [Planctomycetota bacterium]|nr:ATP-binding protein [Planctomycetota bacterium]